MNLAHTLRAVRDVVSHARSSSELFKLIRPGEGEVLNARDAWEPGDGQSATEVLERLTMLRHRLEADAYITEEARVDYARLARSEVFLELEQATRMLHDIALEDVLLVQERKAFFINLYNVLMIHAVIALEIEKSVLEVPTIFSSVGYQVGEHVWTLDAIEHGALRGNAPHPTTRKRPFEVEDARLAWSVPLDPRVHAALVCAAHSCPPIRMYDAEHLDAQLDMASRAFVLGSTHVDHERREVITSSIFAWYEQDFTPPTDQFLLEHSDGALNADLSSAFEAGYALAYTPYDWSLNGV